MIREIHPGLLFIGNAMDARNLQLLCEHRISAVVDLAANESPAHLFRDMIYCRFPIIDGQGSSITMIETAIRCIVALIKNEVRTVVACSAGMSRSPAVSAAALAIITGQSPEDVLTRIVVGAPHDVAPGLWSCVKTAFNQIDQH